MCLKSDGCGLCLTFFQNYILCMYIYIHISVFWKSLQERLKGATKGRKRPRSFIFIEIWGYFSCLVSICHLWVPDVRGRRITKVHSKDHRHNFVWCFFSLGLIHHMTIINDESGTQNPGNFWVLEVEQGFSALFCILPKNSYF